MPLYSLRLRLGDYPEKPDEQVGTFPDPTVALDAVNDRIAGTGKESGNEQMTIKSFGFDESGLDLLCSLKYSLVQMDGTKSTEYRLFPKTSLEFNPFRTTNARGSFKSR